MKPLRWRFPGVGTCWPLIQKQSRSFMKNLRLCFRVDHQQWKICNDCLTQRGSPKKRCDSIHRLMQWVAKLWRIRSLVDSEYRKEVRYLLFNGSRSAMPAI